MKMQVVRLILIPAILSCLLCMPPSLAHIDAQSPCYGHQTNHLICDLHETKLKVAQLESVLDTCIQELNAKSLYLRKSEKLIEEMTHDIDHLQFVLSSIKNNSLNADERLHMLEEKVRLLWATSRKNNFELHTIDMKAQDAKKRLDVVASQVQTMADIVTEQWIQIQQLEQAVQIAEMRALKAKRQLYFTRCTFLKYFKGLFGSHPEKIMEMLDQYLFKKRSSLRSIVSQASHQLERVFSTARHYHHQLQGLIRQEMESNEFTATLANEEVVFFVLASITKELADVLHYSLKNNIFLVTKQIS